MRIELNFKSGKPTYLQITDQVKYAAASGNLRAGDQLPSIRELAEQLRINRNTVSKAYTELEHEGVVETQHGRGVFVTGNASPFKKRVRDEILAESVDAAIVQAHHFQVKDDELMELLQERLREFERRRNGDAG
jgi:GntR family transcriptional regulator